jgi:hypothetical protein
MLKETDERTLQCRRARCGNQNGANPARALPEKSSRIAAGSTFQVPDIGKAYTRALRDEQQQRALLAARADVTQYTIWHKSHTAPVIARGGMALELLRIDVNALGEYVGRLSSLNLRLGLWKDWPAALERLRVNIQHPWWYKKIAYYRALYHLAPDGDRTKARRELAKAGPITKDEADLDLLHLYVDIEFDDQPFAARIAVLDRILALGEERQNQLQYRGAKAIQGDGEG